MEQVNIVIEALKNDLPAVIARRKVGKLTGGLVAPHTLANADSAGTGPAVKVRIGKNIAYTKESFLAWLTKRISQ